MSDIRGVTRDEKYMNFDFIPLWAWFLGTISIVLLSVEIGSMFGRRKLRLSPDVKESTAAAYGGAVLALVVFMLVFTFSMASGRFDRRKELVRQEANAIGTAYLRADFLDDAGRDDVKRLLREYVDVCVELAQSADRARLPQVLVKTSEIQDKLWAYAVANGQKDPNSRIAALFAESVNEVIDIHSLRIAVAIETRIPLGIWFIVYAIAILGMLAVGYQTGVATPTRSRASLFMVISFALVMTLIAGLDRPDTPFISVTQQPLIDARNSMEPPPVNSDAAPQ